MTEAELNEEALQIEELLKGKSISKIFRPRVNEICIECSDKTRFFIHKDERKELDFSIT